MYRPNNKYNRVVSWVKNHRSIGGSIINMKKVLLLLISRILNFISWEQLGINFMFQLLRKYNQDHESCYVRPRSRSTMMSSLDLFYIHIEFIKHILA